VPDESHRVKIQQQNVGQPQQQEQPGVYFNNILRATFLYKSVSRNFFIFGFVIFWQKNIGANAVRKMLVELTTVQHNRVRIVESQQQHPVVVEEIEVDENLEEVVETPAPVRHRVPIASRQPLPEVVRHSEAAPVAETSTEAEVSSPSTTSKVFQTMLS